MKKKSAKQKLKVVVLKKHNFALTNKKGLENFEAFFYYYNWYNLFQLLFQFF